MFHHLSSKGFELCKLLDYCYFCHLDQNLASTNSPQYAQAWQPVQHTTN